PHAVDARHQHARPAALNHQSREEDEPPDRHRQVHVEPALTEGIAAHGDDFLQAGIPRLDELDRKPPAREIAETRKLPIPAGNRDARLLDHKTVGQRNWASSGSRNGLRTLDAKMSNTVQRPSMLNVATKRSDCRVSTICTPSNILNSAHGPANIIAFEPDGGGGMIVARTWLRPPGPGNCTDVEFCGPCEYFTSLPSTSRMNCWMLASISIALNSSWMLGLAPPPRK